MTDQEINIAIAEAVTGVSAKDNPAWIEGYLDGQNDYCHDLNAMHEAEKTMDCSTSAAHDYSINLKAVICRRNGIRVELGSSPLVGDFRFAHATTRQRAEAFLRTKGLWKEQ